MRSRFAIAAVLTALAASAAPAPPVPPVPPHASPQATRDETVALVRRGIEAIRRIGTAKAYAAISQTGGPFSKGELYLMVYDLQGRCLAHGADARLIGQDMSALTDVDGRYFVRERMARAQQQPGGFWQEYRFKHPVTGRIQPKSTYCERLGDTAVCSGLYR